MKRSRESGVQQRAKFMRLSALHKPFFTQTAIGGKTMARMPRHISLPHMLTVFGRVMEKSLSSRGIVL